MAQGETLSEAVSVCEQWQDRVITLLDSYLREFGLSSEATRERWIKRVVEKLATRTDIVATEDILEEAVEQMRDLIEARVARLSNHDPARQHKEIAQLLVVLLKRKNTDCLNMLFECGEDDINMPEHLCRSLAVSSPMPVPPEAPLAMPVQIIELRSINPFRRLFKRRS